MGVRRPSDVLVGWPIPNASRRVLFGPADTTQWIPNNHGTEEMWRIASQTARKPYLLELATDCTTDCEPDPNSSFDDGSPELEPHL
jgi:hypothetical protein